MVSTTFVTNCWERDWEIILKTRFLENKIKRNQYPFTEKVVVINNVNDRVKVERYAKAAVNDGVLTSYFFVEDYIDQALKFFELSRQSLGKGFYYSNHELVSVYFCRTDYLVFYTSDTWLQEQVPWVEPALNELEKNSIYKVANPTWNYKYDEAKSESFSEIGDFYVGYGFSDQCFLVRTRDFRAPIYNEYNVDSERYPEYGGETFEKRVDSWMRNHFNLRLTFKRGSYVHEDFSKNAAKKRLGLAMGKFNL